jgi:DNA gyrase subunit B/topoisomerase-4 subunit B
MEKVLKSIEVQNIITSIGGIDPDKGRVGKIVFLSDSDPDGGHITALLSSLFITVLPLWVKANRVYTIEGPLFHTIYKGKRYFGDTSKEVLKQIKGKPNIMRIKGWGEMKPEDLSYIAFNPKTRMMKAVEYSKRGENTAVDIMGTDSSSRKKLLGI